MKKLVILLIMLLVSVSYAKEDYYPKDMNLPKYGDSPKKMVRVCLSNNGCASVKCIEFMIIQLYKENDNSRENRDKLIEVILAANSYTKYIPMVDLYKTANRQIKKLTGIMIRNLTSIKLLMNAYTIRLPIYTHCKALDL